MKHDRLLVIASVLSVLLMTIHLAEDIVRGMEGGTTSNLLAVPLLVTWLYGALALTGRRAGYVITLLGSLLGASVPLIHFRAAGGVASGGIAASSGALFYVWVLVALGVTAVLALVLSLLGLRPGLPRRPAGAGS
jgi:hypothetical protein